MAAIHLQIKAPKTLTIISNRTGHYQHTRISHDGVSDEAGITQLSSAEVDSVKNGSSGVESRENTSGEVGSAEIRNVV